jgi:hypothetical protein
MLKNRLYEDSRMIVGRAPTEIKNTYIVEYKEKCEGIIKHESEVETN